MFLNLLRANPPEGLSFDASLVPGYSPQEIDKIVYQLPFYRQGYKGHGGWNRQPVSLRLAFFWCCLKHCVYILTHWSIVRNLQRMRQSYWIECGTGLTSFHLFLGWSTPSTNSQLCTLFLLPIAGLTTKSGPPSPGHFTALITSISDLVIGSLYLSLCVCVYDGHGTQNLTHT